MQDTLKGISDPLFIQMLQGEMNNHLDYDSNSKEIGNRRNGYSSIDEKGYRWYSFFDKDEALSV
jgi:hypothetical protein